MTEATLAAIKTFIPAIMSFSIGLMLAPAWLDVLISNKMWKQKSKTKTINGQEATEFQRLHGKTDVLTPRMGGVVIWVTTVLVALILWILALILPPTEILAQLDFVSRSQTWLPIFALLVGATVGMIDDYLEVKGSLDYFVGGLSLKKRLLSVSLLGLACGWWFYDRLDFTSLFIPFIGDVFLGWLVIPIFIVVMIGTYSGGVIDGIDGLSGGVFGSIFTAYGIIAFTQDQFNIAALCFVIFGAILAFLWYNLPPAKFYMTETGTMSLTVTITVIAFLTNQVFLLPIIAMPLVITPLSNIVQLTYKKVYGKKLFMITPIHHHFEAIGWPGYQVTMKYWIVSIICALAGTVLALIS